MYLRELKNYKMAPVKASDAEGHVHKFAMPKPPAPPADGDFAGDLQAYEAQAVDIEGSLPQGEEVVPDDWFEPPELDDSETTGNDWVLDDGPVREKGNPNDVVGGGSTFLTK